MKVKAVKVGYICEIFNISALMCLEGKAGVNLQFSSGVESRRWQRKKKNEDVERELSSELPL